MPGTIHVSVLDFKDLPSSSPPPLTLLKVSMGKREYQTWDKGDFSFPLTNLQEYVTITLQDTEGTEISHKGVRTMSIVEKGSWDEFLPLEGGGHVHLKLQFVLSEEERNRIRSMRESAMKKKRSELLNSSLRCSETSGTAAGIVKSSSCINHEVSGLIMLNLNYEMKDKWKEQYNETSFFLSIKLLHTLQLHSNGLFLDVLSAASYQDSQENVTHHESVRVGDLAIHAGSLPNSESAAGNDGGTAFHPKQIIPADSDGSEETSSAASMSKSSKLVEKSETMLHHVDVSSTTSKNVIASELKNDRSEQTEKQDPLERTPSNVRKIITAFESSLAKDMGPGVKPSAANPQVNRVGLEAPKDLILNKITKPTKLTSKSLKNPFLIGELEQFQTYEVKKEEHIGFVIELNRSKSSQDMESKVKHELQKPQEDLVRMSAIEAATVSGSTREKHSGLHQPHNLLVNRHDSGGTAVVEGRGNGICYSNSHEINVQGSWEDNSSSESSGAWIFPDHARRLCITTGSKQAMDLVGGCGIQERNHQGKKSSSLPENVEKFGDYTEVKEGEETCHEPRKSRVESSAEFETSTGLIAQAIKVAVMVAFGTLVLLTRRRKPR